MMRLRRILVPVDFSAASDRACDLAAELAAAFGSSLLLFQVIEPPPYVLPTDVTASMREAALRELDARARELRRVMPTMDVAVALGEGTPWREIDRAATTGGVDLVVVGTHGRRGVSRAMLGSVSERVVRTSSVPVITVPGYAFTDRAIAAARLVRMFDPELHEGAAVVALSRGALPIAAEAARAVAGTLDLWLTVPIVAEGTVIGAVGEDDRPVLDAGVSAVAADAARVAMRDELTALRGARSPGEMWRRTLILVADALVHPAPVIAAARALRAEGPTALVLAVPVARRDVLAACEAQVDQVLCLERTTLSNRAEAWYRDHHLPSDAAAHELLDSPVTLNLRTRRPAPAPRRPGA